MPRKKAVPITQELEIKPAVTSDVVDVTPVVKDIEEAGETVEMIWVETVDEFGKHMIQIPKT